MHSLLTPTRSALSRGAAGTLLALLPIAGCASLRNLNVYSLDQDVELGTQAYEQMLAQEKLITSGPEYERVQRVTRRLVESAKELHPEYAGFPWEAVLIDRPDAVNAWCLPGGKMAVYTGILPVTQDDVGLAVVMGHEITHATERHGTKRLTRNMGMDGITTAIAILTDQPSAGQVAGVLGQLGIGLPWGRQDELSADAGGLMIMANAGYDPRQAPGFWERMRELSGGAGEGLAEYFSTHPSNTARIDQIRDLLPKAMELYPARTGTPGT
jgi:predicted Zn-dependent protease